MAHATGPHLVVRRAPQFRTTRSAWFFLSFALAGLGLGCGGGGGTRESPTTGSLVLTITGLPGGVNAAVTVTGPGGFSQAVTASQTLTALDPAGYTVTATAVSSGGTTYGPAPLTQTVTVVAGNTAGATVTYTAQIPTTGSLALTITGLPGGVTANLTVSGPGGFNQGVTGSRTLTGLVPGAYTVTATVVSSGGTSYGPAPLTQAVTVIAGASASATVTYTAQAPTTGSLALTITGLPGGVNAAVTVTGPGGFNQAVTASQTLTALLPGSYTVTALAVSSGGTTYAPTPLIQAVTVTAGATASATVTYAAQAPTTGSLALTITGLPGGANAAVTVTGPGGFSQAVTGSQTLGALILGSYTVTATVVSSGGTTYGPAPLTQAVTVSAGATASATVTYSVASPVLSIAIVRGDGQTGYVSNIVTVPPAVVVRDGIGLPVSGVSVVFVVTMGGGSVTVGQVMTDINGEANAGIWTMGPVPGQNELQASISSAPAVFVTFTAQAVPFTDD